MPVTKYDYPELEKQFVYAEDELSIRKLCEINGIKTWSTVSEYAKRNGWREKRAEVQRRQQEANIQKVVDTRADKLAKALDDAIMVANQAIYAFWDSIRERWVVDPDTGQRVFVPARQDIPPADFVKILEKVMVLNGQFTSREARVEIDVSATTDMEMLRELLSAAKSAGAEADPVAASPLPRLEGARKVN